MSYILDALKKSDQERQENTGPTLQTIQRPSPTKSGTVRKTLLFICFFVLFSMMLIGAYFLVDEEKIAKILQRSSPAVDAEKIVETPEKSNARAIPENIAPNPLPAKASKPAVVELWELPDSVQKNIPAMTFSFHVYSENPSRRTIIINKRRVKEGETISEGLVLEEITQQGLILDWNNATHRFTINVVENW